MGTQDSEKAADRRTLKADAAAAKARAKAARPFYRKKRVLIPAAILLLIIVIAATSGGGEPTSAPGALRDEAAEPSDDNATAGIGEPARDGKFEFTISGIECGVTEVGGEFASEQPQGQFCLLSLRIENIGKESAILLADNQLLLDGEGTQYSADSMATITHNPDGDELFSQINPGNAIEGVIVFDVPTDAKITRAELHDSPFSNGVEIALAP